MKAILSMLSLGSLRIGTYSPFDLIVLLLQLLVFGLSAWTTIDYIRILRLRRSLPPGPFPLPLIGNHFHMRQPRPWTHWEQLAIKYDEPLLTLWNGHRPVVVCSDAWVASDLFEKRANIYSSRPRFVMMGEMTNTSEYNQVCLKYGDKWRLHRKLTHAVVGSQAVRNYRSPQSDESKLLLQDLLKRPDHYVPSVERYSCSVAAIVGWGRHISQLNDPIAQRALQFMEVVNAVIPGQALMEIIPGLTRLPWWINPLPSIIGKAATEQSRYFYEMTRDAAKKSTSESFSTRLMKEQEASDLHWRDIGNLTSNLIGGGVDTTSSSIISFILAMCCFPSKQKQAQEELDSIVGRDRMPDWSDETSLPYVTATMSEVLRWRTVTVLGGLPHAPTEDNEYRGYHIPKDTWVVGNIWAIHRNPRDYPEPDSFRPERFLNGLERPHPSKKGHSAFGWGRRQCSGQPLAEQGIWLVVARMLWAFEIRPGLHDEGNEVKLDIFAYNASENQRPLPFRARFIPRDERVIALINDEAKAAREHLATTYTS